MTLRWEFLIRGRKQKMKSILIYSLIFILIISSPAFGQCKYLKNEKDRFSGNHVIETKGKVLRSGLNLNIAVQGRKVNDSKFLKIQILGRTIFSVTEGMKLDLLTTEGEVITLLSAEIIISDNFGIYLWSGFIHYYLPDEAASLLIGKKIEALRIHTVGNKYFEKDIKPKYQKNISDIIECIN